MGVIKHNAIIVTGYGDSLLKAYSEASNVFGDLVSFIIKSRGNGYGSFLIAPDGSKEGWEVSNMFNDKRNSFTDWLKTIESVDFVEVEFGGDTHFPKIIECNL